MKKHFLASVFGVLVSMLIFAPMFAAGPRLVTQEDLAVGPKDNTVTEIGHTGHRIPRYYDNNAFTDNLTLYGNDIITKGPWVDVRAYGAVLDGTTDDSAAFAAAVAAATPNGTVVIPGTMAIGSNGWTGINLTGLSNVTIRGEKGGKVKLLFLPSQTYDIYSVVMAIKFTTSDNVTVRDLIFDMNSIKSGALGFDNCSGSIVTLNKFTNIEYSDVARPFVSAVKGARNKFINNDFTGGCYQLVVGMSSATGREKHSIVSGNTFNNRRGCLAMASEYSTVSNNIFTKCDAGSTYIPGTYPTHDTIFIGNHISNCTDTDLSSYAFGKAIQSDPSTSGNSYNMSFVGNAIDNCFGSIYVTYTDNSVISGNIFSGTGVGVYTLSSNSLTISGNYISGGNPSGDNASLRFGAIALDTGANFNITGNTFSNFGRAGEWGIRSYSNPVTDILAVGNIFDNTDIGLYLFGATDNVLASNNYFYNTPSYDMFIYNGSNFYGSNNFGTKSIYFDAGTIRERVWVPQSNTYHSVGYAAAVPSDNTVTWVAGDTVYNTGTDNVIGWRCTVGGAPGTWKYLQATMEP